MVERIKLDWFGDKIEERRERYMVKCSHLVQPPAEVEFISI